MRLKGKGTSQKKKRCVKSTAYPCGFACINIKDKCHNVLRGQAKTYALWLEEVQGRLVDINTHRRQKGKALIGLVKDKGLTKLAQPQQKGGLDTQSHSVRNRQPFKLNRTEGGKGETSSIEWDIDTNSLRRQIEERVGMPMKQYIDKHPALKSIFNNPESKLAAWATFQWVFNAVPPPSRKTYGEKAQLIERWTQMSLEKAHEKYPRLFGEGNINNPNTLDNFVSNVKRSGLLLGGMLPEDVFENAQPHNFDIEKIKKDFKKLATKYHPDTGGSEEQFQILNKLKGFAEKKQQLKDLTSTYRELIEDRFLQNQNNNQSNPPQKTRSPLVEGIISGKVEPIATTELGKAAKEVFKGKVALDQKLADMEARSKEALRKIERQITKKDYAFTDNPETNKALDKALRGNNIALERFIKRLKETDLDTAVSEVLSQKAPAKQTGSVDELAARRKTQQQPDNVVPFGKKETEKGNPDLVPKPPVKSKSDNVRAITSPKNVVPIGKKEKPPSAKSKPTREQLIAEENRLGKELDVILNKYPGRRTPEQQREIDAKQAEYRAANRAIRGFNGGKAITSNEAVTENAIAPTPKKAEKQSSSSETSVDDEVLRLENEAWRKEMAAGDHLIGGYTTLNTPQVWERERMGLDRKFKSGIKKAELWADGATDGEITKQKKAIASAERKLEKTTEEGWLDKNIQNLVFEGPHLMMPSPEYERAMLSAMQGDMGKALESYYDRRKKEIASKTSKGVDYKKVAYHADRAREYEVQQEDFLKAAQQLKTGSILGVKLTGNTEKDYEKVKASYRKLVKKHHPDVGGDPAEFRKVQAEWETFALRKGYNI